MASPSLQKRYEFFVHQGKPRSSAKFGNLLARAEQIAEGLGWKTLWTSERELRSGARVSAVLKDSNGNTLAKIEGSPISKREISGPERRTYEAELALEALQRKGML